MTKIDEVLLDDYHDAEMTTYRRICPQAIASLILGIVAVPLVASTVLTMPPALFAVAPALGLILGVIALRQIARVDDLTGRGPAWIGTLLSAIVLVSGLTGRFVFDLTEVPEGYERISYEILQPEPGTIELVPESARDLNSQKVFIKGYMYPTSQQRGITTFVLCRDKGECCFGGQPKMSDMIKIRVPREKAVAFHTGLRSVAGTFRVENATSEISTLGTLLYQMDADFVR